MTSSIIGSFSATTCLLLRPSNRSSRARLSVSTSTRPTTQAQPSLTTTMDEVCGRANFVATNVWQKRYSRENRESIGDVHEYLVVYAKDVERFKVARNRVPITEAHAKIYKNPNNDPKGRWRGIPMTAQGYRPNQMYPITTPTGVVHHPPEGRCWSTIESEYLKLLNAGRIWFGKDGDSQPNTIRYLSEVEGMVPWTWWPSDEVATPTRRRKRSTDCSARSMLLRPPSLNVSFNVFF